MIEPLTEHTNTVLCSHTHTHTHMHLLIYRPYKAMYIQLRMKHPWQPGSRLVCGSVVAASSFDLCLKYTQNVVGESDGDTCLQT